MHYYKKMWLHITKRKDIQRLEYLLQLFVWLTTWVPWMTAVNLKVTHRDIYPQEPGQKASFGRIFMRSFNSLLQSCLNSNVVYKITCQKKWLSKPYLDSNIPNNVSYSLDFETPRFAKLIPHINVNVTYKFYQLSVFSHH